MNQTAWYPLILLSANTPWEWACQQIDQLKKGNKPKVWKQSWSSMFKNSNLKENLVSPEEMYTPLVDS